MRGSLKVRSLECEEEEEVVKELAVIPRFIRSPPPPLSPHARFPFSFIVRMYCWFRVFMKLLVVTTGEGQDWGGRVAGSPSWPPSASPSPPPSRQQTPLTRHILLLIFHQERKERKKRKSDNHILVNDIYHSR